MFKLLRSLVRNKRLLRDFVLRDLKARYVGSSMGFFWSVMFPIINLFVYMFVFRLILRMRWQDQAGPGPTAIVMLVGILVWVAFSETISRTTNTLVENANLIQKVVFPSEILPVFLTFSSLFNMLVGLPIALCGVVYFGYVKADTQVAALERPTLEQSLEQTIEQAPDESVPSASAPAEAQVGAPGQPESDSDRDRARDAIGAGIYEPQTIREHRLRFGSPLIMLPLLIVLQLVFTLGLGYFLAAFNLLLRDTFHLIGVFITVWMFMTPIFYPDFMIPDKYTWILEVNPMYWLIESYRYAVLYGEWPQVWMLLRFGLVSVLTFAAGSHFFMSQKDRFPDLL